MHKLLYEGSNYKVVTTCGSKFTVKCKNDEKVFVVSEYDYALDYIKVKEGRS